MPFKQRYTKNCHEQIESKLIFKSLIGRFDRKPKSHNVSLKYED